MKKIAPAVAVIVLASAMASLVYFATRGTKPNDPPIDNTVEPGNATFETEDLMLVFDESGDGIITFAEFDALYGKPDYPVFHEGDGKPALSAADAFKRWDINHNGTIDADDIRRLGDKEWLRGAEALAKQGLHAISWQGRQIGLNDHQMRTYETEEGAAARGEFPFAGAFWDKSRLAARWSRVVDNRGEAISGFVTEKDGKVWVLTEEAELVVKDAAKVEVTAYPDDDPHMLYAFEVAKLKFHDTQGNLELARKCVNWGLKADAGILYARVLIFERGNQEALDALGFKLEGNKFVSKG